MCDKPPLGRIHAHLVQDSLYDWMKLWIEKSVQPPHAPPITVLPNPSGSGQIIVRDENGNARGGIRLAQFAVPIATDTGENSGGQNCNIFGSHIPFDAAKLARLYPSHKAYVDAVERIAEENLKAGFVTKEGAAEMKREAALSNIGAVPRR